LTGSFSRKFDEGTCKREDEMAVLVEVMMRLLI